MLSFVVNKDVYINQSINQVLFQTEKRP